MTQDQTIKRRTLGRRPDPEAETRRKRASEMAKVISDKSGLTPQQIEKLIGIGSGDGNSWNRLLRGESAASPTRIRLIANAALEEGWFGNREAVYFDCFADSYAKLDALKRKVQLQRDQNFVKFEDIVETLLVDCFVPPSALIDVIVQLAAAENEIQ